MKVRPQQSSWVIPRARLYLDDVRRLVKAFEDVGLEPSVASGPISFDNVEELPQAGARLSELQIHGRSKQRGSDATLHFGPNSYFVAISSPLTKGLYAECLEIMRPRKIVAPTLATGASVWALAVSSTVLLESLLLDAWKWRWLFAWGFLLILPTAFLVGGLESFHKPAIFTIAKNASPSFWQRKRDEIILAVISALVGAAVSAVFLRLF